MSGKDRAALAKRLRQHIRDVENAAEEHRLSWLMNGLEDVEEAAAQLSDRVALVERLKEKYPDWRGRSEEDLRRVLQMLCDFVWNGGKAQPGQHFWTIPPDPERDFDCILSDAITELVELREEP